MKDIEGNVIKVGQTVYYARKRDYYANGELIKTVVTAVNEKKNNVLMGKYISTNPETQILIKS